MYIPLHLKPYWWYKYPSLNQKDNLLEFIKSCTKESGGITNGNNKNEYLETVFYTIVLLGLIDSPKIIEDKTVNYILEREKDDGGFADSIQHHATLFNTFFAICSLSILDRISPRIRNNTIKYLENNIIKADGIYDVHHLQMSTTSLYWAIIIMKCLMYDIGPKRNLIVEFCLKCYDPIKNLFAPFPHAIPTIQNTYESIVILRELSALALFDHERTARAIHARKRQKFYFDDLLKKDTFCSAMWAIGSLNLINKLNKLENIDVLSYVKSVFEKPNSVFDSFCAANILANMTYEEGLVNINNTNKEFENGITTTIAEVDRLTLKLKKSGMDVSEYDYTYLLRKGIYNTTSNNEFLQIMLNAKANRYYEIEYSNKNMVGTQKAIARVKKETIVKRVINKGKIKVFGIFDPKSDLGFSNEEYEIIKQYCQDNHIFRMDLLKAEEVSSVRINECLNNCYNIFYYSGHSDNGFLYFRDDEYAIDYLLNKLTDNNCHIAIFNSCNTYQYVKSFFLDRNSASDNFNVICSIYDVHDEMGKWFLITFLYYFELGLPISEALRYTKKDLSIKMNLLGISWWGYLLFGNPYTIIA